MSNSTGVNNTEMKISTPIHSNNNPESTPPLSIAISRPNIPASTDADSATVSASASATGTAAISSSSNASAAASAVAVRPSCSCSFLHPNRSCLAFIFSSFGRAFYLAYGLRAGLSLALHIIKLIRLKPKSLLNLKEIFGVNGLPLDAVRMGLFLGGFTGIYNAINCILIRLRNGKFDSKNVFTAGGLAGLSLLVLDADSHRTLALYLFARVIQAYYNAQKAAGKFHFWGSKWPHGDTLLFSLSSAQILYSYVMRPDTLPPTYLKFMLDTAPLHSIPLGAVRNLNRGAPIDLQKLYAYAEKFRSAAWAGLPAPAEIMRQTVGPHGNPAFPLSLPCTLIHPETPLCRDNVTRTAVRAFKRVFPLYLSLTFVPMFVLRFWSLLRNPIQMISHGVFSTIRSSIFIVVFVSSYMNLTCIQRKSIQSIGIGDHRFIYWLCGLISGSAVLIEVKSRRSELALYCLPRALDSLFLGLVDRKLLFSIPKGELLLFSLSMSILMFYREFQPQNLSPLLLKILYFFIPSNRNLPNYNGNNNENNNNDNYGNSINNHNSNGIRNSSNGQEETLIGLGKGILSPDDNKSNNSLNQYQDQQLQSIQPHHHQRFQFSPTPTPEPSDSMDSTNNSLTNNRRSSESDFK